MNIGGLIVLERDDGMAAFTLEDLRARVDERTASLPHLRSRLAEVPFDLARPVWIRDHTFRIDQHVREASIEGADKDDAPSWPKILRFAERTQGLPFDRRKPLWDLTLLPGATARQQVLHVRFHHALVDGLRAIATAVALFDHPGGGVTGQAPPGPAAAIPSAVELVEAAIAEGAVGHIRHGLELVIDTLDPVASLRRQRRVIEGALTFLGLPPAPQASLNGSVGPERRYRTAVVSSADLIAIRRRYRVSVHDVVLGLVAGALARLFAARGQPQQVVRALVPMARQAQPASRLVGNHAAFCFVDVPVSPATDGDRLLAVAAATTAAKQSPQVATSSDFIGWADDEPPLLTTYKVRSLADYQDVNLVVSYLRWPRRLPTMLGARHVATYPLLPLAGRIGLFVGVVEAGGQAGFGITCDPAIVPEPGFLSSALRETAIALLNGCG